MTLALLVLGVAGALGPRVTLARADTVTVTIADADGTAVPAAGVLSIATVTGQGDGGRSLMTKYRLSGGAGCAGSAAEDTGALLFSLPLFTDDAFTATQTVVIADPGPYLICTWLSSGAADGPATPISQIIVVRPTAATATITAVPASADAGAPTSVTLAGNSDVQGLVLATYRPADGRPCAATYLQEPGTTFVESAMSAEGPFIFDDTIPFTPGSWLICAWVDRVAAGTLGGPPVFQGLSAGPQLSGPFAATVAVGSPSSNVTTPPRATPSTPVARLATTVRSVFSPIVHGLRLSVTSRVTATRTPAGRCRLQLLGSRGWRNIGAAAGFVAAKRSCTVTASFASVGRKRLRVAFLPGSGFAASVGPATWVRLAKASRP